MTDGLSRLRWTRGWCLAAIVAGAVGLLGAVAFSVAWFPHASRGDGLVRFYEEAFGLLVVAGWIATTAVGAGVVFFSRRAGSKAPAAGWAVIILAGGLMAVVCVWTVHDLRQADYSLKDTPRLMALLSGQDLDARKEAAHALGERKASEAVGPLCVILDSDTEDINLRHNAAIALGKICARPCGAEVDIERVLASLTGAIGSGDEYLPSTAIEALGRIGDTRSVAPIAAVLADASRPMHARRDAIGILARIGGPEAREILEQVRDSEPAELADAARRCLSRMRP